MFRLILALSLFFLSCKKTEKPAEIEVRNQELQHGLPDNMSEINGYFYTSYSSNSYHSAYAIFNDPAKDLLKGLSRLGSNVAVSGNVSVGKVWNSGAELVELVNTSVWYEEFYSVSPNYTAQPITWQIEGNNTYVPYAITLKDNFESPVDTNFYEFSKSSDGVIKLAHYNYDSMIVNLNPLPEQKIAAGTQHIVFPKSLLQYLNPGWFTLIIRTHRYSNSMVQEKRYVFDVENYLSVPVKLTP